MKILFALICSFLVAENLHACCMGDWVEVYPLTNTLTQNPVFLLEYDEQDYKLADKWGKLEFCLLVNNGQKVGVQILQTVIGVGANSQLLLKPDKLLALNDSVQLVANYKKSKGSIFDEQFELFQSRVKNRKWKITQTQDLEPVTWEGDFSWKYPELINASISTRAVDFTYQLNDSNPVYYEYVPGKTTILNLFEVEIDGRKFFSLGGGPKSVFSIFESTCGGNFYLHSNKKYQATITALDFSGNRSKETKQVAFNTSVP